LKRGAARTMFSIANKSDGANSIIGPSQSNGVRLQSCRVGQAPDFFSFYQKCHFMKNIIFAASLLALTSTAMASNVGVSVNIGEPGFYGRIDIGNFPQPRVVYAQPVIVERPVRYVEQQPIYLRVPPGHAKHWSKHCRAYHACGQQVYFVQDSWYTSEYAPRYREQHGDHYDRHANDRDDRGDKHDKHDKRDKHGHGNGHHKD
jgi:hypothetical protein